MDFAWADAQFEDCEVDYDTIPIYIEESKGNKLCMECNRYIASQLCRLALGGH